MIVYGIDLFSVCHFSNLKHGAAQPQARQLVLSKTY